ncbi:hypothetical protein JL720_4037 [Aureococcus anophagefferens]|nr:hypothetical protein JL720_4037 [Aureococcus anophagefferens]
MRRRAALAGWLLLVLQTCAENRTGRQLLVRDEAHLERALKKKPRRIKVGAGLPWAKKARSSPRPSPRPTPAAPAFGDAPPGSAATYARYHGMFHCTVGSPCPWAGGAYDVWRTVDALDYAVEHLSMREPAFESHLQPDFDVIACDHRYERMIHSQKTGADKASAIGDAVYGAFVDRLAAYEKRLKEKCGGDDPALRSQARDTDALKTVGVMPLYAAGHADAGRGGQGLAPRRGQRHTRYESKALYLNITIRSVRCHFGAVAVSALHPGDRDDYAPKRDFWHRNLFGETSRAGGGWVRRELEGYGAKRMLSVGDDLRDGSCCYLKRGETEYPATGGEAGGVASTVQGRRLRVAPFSDESVDRDSPVELLALGDHGLGILAALCCHICAQVEARPPLRQPRPAKPGDGTRRRRLRDPA